MNLRLDRDVLQLLDLIRESASGMRVYLVGGAVRDLLLGQPAKDLDFVQAHGSIQLAKAVSRRLNAAMYTLDDVRHSARVILRQGEEDEQILDFTSFIGEDLEEDLRQRDFTVNAMALDLEEPERLIDPLGGKADLDTGLLRLCSTDSLMIDPVRVLRGVRLASAYNLSHGAEIIGAMRVATKRLGLVSGERIRDELFKCLAVPDFKRVVDLLHEFGILYQLRVLTFGVDPLEWIFSQQSAQPFTGLITLADFLQSTGSTEQSVTGSHSFWWDREDQKAYQAILDQPLQGGRQRRHLLLLCSIMMHWHPVFDLEAPDYLHLIPEDFAKQLTRTFLTGQKEQAYFEAVAGGFLRLADLSVTKPGKLDYYRFFRDFGAYGLDSALLAMVEIQTQGEKYHFAPEIPGKVFHIWFKDQAQTVNPPRLVDGNLLQKELSIKPGSQIGRLLEEIREQQVLGNVNSVAEAIAFARNKAKKAG